MFKFGLYEVSFCNAMAYVIVFVGLNMNNRMEGAIHALIFLHFIWSFYFRISLTCHHSLAYHLQFFKDFYSNVAGEEKAYQYRGLIYLLGSASAEFFADAALCPMEMVKVRCQYTSFSFIGWQMWQQETVAVYNKSANWSWYDTHAHRSRFRPLPREPSPLNLGQRLERWKYV